MATRNNETIQIMRGIAITVVLVRHAIAQVNAGIILTALEQIIICFHMPIFFVIAGYFRAIFLNTKMGGYSIHNQ